MEWTDIQRGARKLLKPGERKVPDEMPALPVAGDKFFESRPPHHVWIVNKVYQPPASKLPHVLLDRCGKFPASKLISTEALFDTQFFRRDRRDPFTEESDTLERRRQTDRRSSS